MIIVGLFYMCVCARAPMSEVQKTIFSLYLMGWRMKFEDLRPTLCICIVVSYLFVRKILAV